jgi:hypothetical protein
MPRGYFKRRDCQRDCRLCTPLLFLVVGWAEGWANFFPTSCNTIDEQDDGIVAPQMAMADWPAEPRLLARTAPSQGKN